jgi:hypothetical protein
MRRTFVSFCLLALLLFWSVVAWSADATGFALISPCGSPPFGSGDTDMQLHLTRFPKQRRGQVLEVKMPSMLGPSGVRDWADAVADVCITSDPSRCSKARKARVQVLNYSARNVSSPHTSGRFEVILADGTFIKGTFAVRERQPRPLAEAMCE